MAGYYLNFTCFKCNEKSLSTKGCDKEISSYIVKNLDMDGMLSVTCPKCNGTIIVVNQCLQFEICLQCAIERFLTADYAEAVFLLAKSREAFVEFVIDLLCYERELNVDLNKNGLHLSERRYGFFDGLYFMRFRDVMNLNAWNMDIRNKIMHNGIYPKRQDVIEFGNNILQFFYQVIEKIKSEIPTKVYMGYVYSIKQCKIDTYKQTFKDKKVQIQTVSDAIDFFTRDVDGNKDFESLCCIIEQNNKMLAVHSINLETLNNARRQ